MPVLTSSQRTSLENTIVKARKIAEIGARNALMAIAVDQVEPFPHLLPEQRVLRRRLRNRARLLGDILDGKVQQIDHLEYELAYEYWHKMLFAKFLERNGLLIHPIHGISVSMADCEELAKEEFYPDKWTAAAHYASQMLPAIFRTDDPLMQLDFSTEDRIALENLLVSIDENAFSGTDSLGWVYQFWQSEAKDRINSSGDKIDGEKLPAVTQLFTEPYMVHFLIDNTIGSWWVSRYPNEIPPVKFEYIRFLDDGSPAAGKFEGWASKAADFTMLDPCMGSGHFIVETFNVLAKLRIHEEGLAAVDAAKKTIAENIFGLELDPRCTQIAAFNLALAAWKFMGGYQPLPEMNLACSGVAPRGKKDDWTKLAGKDDRMQNGMAALYDLFQQAPELGSLLDPSTIKADAFCASFAELQPTLEQALEKEIELKNDEQAERGVMALGINSAAKILSRKFDLIITNVPYLSRGKQDEVLAGYCFKNFPDSKADLATIFLDRILKAISRDGTIAVVLPQNWLFMASYKKFRERLIKEYQWNFLARLGPGAFSQITGEVVKAILFSINKIIPSKNHLIAGIDASKFDTVQLKDQSLKNGEIKFVSQHEQLKNPDSKFILDTDHNQSEFPILEKFAKPFQGIKTGDDPKFKYLFWEVNKLSHWKLAYGGPLAQSSQGCHYILNWQNEGKDFARFQGFKAFDKCGFYLTNVGRLTCNSFDAKPFTSEITVLIPFNEKLLPAINCYLKSETYETELRKIDQNLAISTASVAKVPFDRLNWERLAKEKFPDGLMEPFSNDPTQWVFKGDIVTSENPLQVAVGRLLGYHWPEQPENLILDNFEDDDGIVCIPAVNGEPTTSDRLRELLKNAYGKNWDNHTIEELLKLTGSQSLNLDFWLRDQFFNQHIKLFQNRPFIWHIWDGRKDGFGVLVNYLKLTKENLQKVVFTYLGDWIRQCEARVRNNESGSDGLLIAAKELKRKLELILEGEPPHDIFVRWKPLYKQPIGWDPDINDGVRLNIRPFMEANILRNKPNIKWDKDRGKNPDTSLYGTVERINDKHFTLAEKREAREKFKEK